MASGAVPDMGHPAPKPTPSKPSSKRRRSDPFEPFFTDYRRYKQAISSEFEKQWNSEHMCEDQREQLNALLEEIAGLFNGEGPPITVIDHLILIEVGDVTPILWGLALHKYIENQPKNCGSRER